ncbi:MAG: hypothetical protein J1F16_05790 [Muribaculaceae bacterium]|nr:hypothetical protein [Muribaculaceae bacterium]
MKKKNSKCEFSSERSLKLLQNFRESLARQSKISAVRAFKDAAEMPAPRFWVSEARAMRIVSRLFQGIDLTTGMHSEKREMYLEIYRRTKVIKERNPETPLGDIVFDVVNNPAPRSYLTWQYARKIINKAKRHVE